jgi:hypothetical protein
MAEIPSAGEYSNSTGARTTGWSCPRGWYRSGVVFALSGGFSPSSQAATAGSVRIGSSLNGAMVSRVM